jgi:site-specific recombinase
MQMKTNRSKKLNFFEQLISQNTILPATDKQAGLQFLTSLFAAIRPGSSFGKKTAEEKLQLATTYIKENPIVKANVQHAVLSQLTGAHLTPAITESGIPLARGFWQELANRLKHKLLPQLQNENDFLYVINSVFYKRSDFVWVESISQQTWVDFFEEVSEGFSGHSATVRTELIHSLKILSFQATQLGLEKEIEDYLPPETNNYHTPFLEQNDTVKTLIQRLGAPNGTIAIRETALILKGQILSCYQLIDYIREKHAEKGASLQQTYLLLILNNRLQRMQMVIDILDGDSQFDTGRFVALFRLLIRFEKRKNSIREFMSQGAGYLAYQIAEHKGTKGHKYITSTRKEYYKMIRTAMWGGFIISFIAILKNLIGKLKLAPFPLGFLFSVNYSAGFILIEETKSTLATKQPAFTASAVASSLDTKKIGEPDIDGLAKTVAKVSRSQIASFFGNLIIVFPLTFILAWVYDLASGNKIAEGVDAFNLLKAQHPWRSPALLYASFTGFFLFLSGIIAGYWQNKIQYGRIKERLQRHPILKLSFSQKRIEKMGAYAEKNFGALVGSIALGFFLGFSGVMIKIIGVPFDIRHITISAGNTAIGTYGLGVSHIPPLFLLAVFGGVLLIGFVNFLVSFSLAFFVAVKSRGIHLSQYPKLFRKVSTYFFTNTREFFLPDRAKKRVVYRPLSGNE